MKRLFQGIAIGVLVALSVIGVVAPKVQRSLLRPPSWAYSKDHVLLEVKSGASAAAVARQLADEGLIRSARAFGVMLRQNGWDLKLKPGLYRIRTGQHSEQIAQQIVNHDTLRVKVTLPEGLTLRQIAQKIQNAGKLESGQWLPSAPQIEKAATSGLLKQVTGIEVPGATAEGYLFPATYDLEAGASAKQIVTRLLREFHRRFSGRWAKEIGRNDLSANELVTLASVVEREAAADKERPLVARVFLNRLEIGQKLESCATVQYALPAHKSRLLLSDTRVDSPYNTYIHAGLPPGPICSPGEASLMAALRPGKTDALYFVSRGDGTHVFSRTFAQHERAIDRVRGK